MNKYIIESEAVVKISNVSQSSTLFNYYSSNFKILSFKIEKILVGAKQLPFKEGAVFKEKSIYKNTLFEFETDEDALLYYEVMK